MGEPVVVEMGTKEFHQAEALRCAGSVRHQYTRQAKKQVKRECLSHLLASLSASDEGAKSK